MPKLIPALVALILVFTGCKDYVRREKNTYAAEVKLMERASLESASVISNMIDKFCICQNGEWSDQVCEEADEIRAVMAQRMPYHTGMMLFLADIQESSPEEVDNLTLKCGGN
jgi:hypothetical protein